MSAFRVAAETKDARAMEAVLAPGIRFSSPAVHAPYEGRDTVMTLLRAVFEVFEDFRYVGEQRVGSDEVLRFTARVGDREIEGVDLIRYGDDGLVAELTVMIRPLQGLQAVVAAMGARLSRGT